MWTGLRLVTLGLGLLLLAAPAQSQDRSVDERILDILLDRGIIDRDTYDEIVAEARAEAGQGGQLDLLHDQMERLRAPQVVTTGGKPGKLTWASEDGKWSVGFKGRVQVRAEAERGESGNSKDDKRNFSVPRARLRFYGKAGREDLTYRLEIDTPTNDKVVDAAKGDSKSQRKEFALKDAWLKWKFDDNTSVKFGQYKFPFGREVHIASTKINLVNESIASKAFSPAREPGVMLAGAAGNDGLFQYWVGVSDGDGQGGGNNSGEAGSSATGLRRGVRVVVNPLGKVAEDGAAFQTVGDGSTKVALGASWMQNIDVISDKTAGATHSSDDTTLGLEMQVVSGPMSFLAEHFDRTMDFGSSGPDKDDDGFNAQVGVFLVPSEIEMVLRHSEIDFAGKVGGDIEETTVGVNFYDDKHNAKWAIDISDIRHPHAVKKDSMRARAQYQLVF